MDYSTDANNKKSNRKKSHRKKRKNSVGIILLRLLFIIIIVGGFAVAGGLLGAYMGIIESTPSLNTADVKPESYTSFIYDADGNEIDNLHGEENREYVQLSMIPKNLQNAVIAIEDERFYDHNGVDIKGMFRALVVNVTERNFSQGASTLTQQLIKNTALDSEKKLKRKIQEQYLAVNFEKDLEKTLGTKKKAKDYILELYLNSISLNHGLNGVQAASKFYFGKDVSELTLAECASIAGITKNPSAYSPISNAKKNKERQMLVLNKMLELNYITQSQFDSAAAEDIYSKLVGNNDADNSSPSVHSYFVDALIKQLVEDLVAQRNMNEKQAYNLIYSGGLKIESTVDMNMQSIMEQAYKNDDYFPPQGNNLDVSYTISIMDNATKEQTHTVRKTTVSTKEEAEEFRNAVKAELLNSNNTFVLDNLSVTNSLQSAMSIMDYRNGDVKAIVGGRGEKPGDLVLNRATQSPRQPGSCFKPLAAYAPAIDLGILMPGSVIIDEPFSVGKWSPKNWNGRFKGACTVREGIRDSMNVLAAKTIMMVGADKAYEYLLNFGFSTIVEADKGPSTALGGITNGVSVLELTAAYSAIANGGEYNKPRFYTKVYDHDGQILLERKDEPTRVIKETTAYLLTDMMKDVIVGGGEATGHKANFRNIKMNISGKTGTTNESKDLTFAGFTPYYCAGIWLGFDTPKPMTFRQDYHMILWRDIMEQIHSGLENKEFPKPDGIVTRSFCSASGDVPIKGVCENDYYGNAIASDISASDFGSSTDACTYHKSFRVDLSTGQLANEYCPADSVSSVVLAVDPDTDEIVNKPNPMPDDKVSIDVHSTCTTHNASTKAKEELDKLNQEQPIGSDEPPAVFPGGPIIDDNTSNSGSNSTQNGGSSEGNNSNIPIIPPVSPPIGEDDDNEGGAIVPPPDIPPEDNNATDYDDQDLFIPD